MPTKLRPLYVEPVMPTWWDKIIVYCTVMSLGILLYDMGLHEDEPLSVQLGTIDLGFCLFFLVDFAVRFGKATDKGKFIYRNWIDIVGAIPLVGPLRAARVVRLVRIIRMTRVAALVIKLLRRRGIRLQSRALGNLLIVTTVLWFAFAVLFYYFEQGTNEGIQDIDDALWWSITTLSTVGYGDLYPGSDGGRLIAGTTMIVGIGVLGTLAGTIGSVFIEVRERARKGLRSFSLKDHLLVLGWNDRASLAVTEFRHDPRYQGIKVCILADLEETPIDDDKVFFVRGDRSRKDQLERASAANAAAVIVFAVDPSDPRSDHETALTIHAFRRMNTEARISAELVEAGNRDHLEAAGCDAIVDVSSVTSNMLVRSVQDYGVCEVIEELLSNSVGSEIYRVKVPSEFVGKSFRDYAISYLDDGCCVIGIVRDGKIKLNPDNAGELKQGDEAFVVSPDPLA